MKTIGAFFVGIVTVVGVVVGAIFGWDAYDKNQDDKRERAIETQIEDAATRFVDGYRDSDWAEMAITNYAFPLDRYHNIVGPVYESDFRDGDARLWINTESMSFTVLKVDVIERNPDGTIDVNVNFNARRINKPNSDICREQRATKVMRLTLVRVVNQYKIKSEDDNSAPYVCV